jgi:hypothetical protein
MRRSFRTRVCFSGVDSQGWHPGLVCEAPSGHGIGTVVFEWLQRSRVDTSGRDAYWGMDAGSKYHRAICPRRGNAYQPRVPTLGTASERRSVF